MKSKINPGQYKHFKGGMVTVIGVAKHSEDYGEELVVYSHPYEGHDQLWARPVAMFLEDVEVDGQRVPRFAFIGDNT